MVIRLKKNLEVTCAIIKNGDSFFCARRASTEKSMPSKIEFPGGKVYKGELKEDCIVREIKEELGIDIYLIEDLVTIKHEYEDFIIILHVFVCGIKYGDIKLTVHDEGYWCSFDELLRFDWDECDIKIFSYLKEFLESKDKQ